MLPVNLSIEKNLISCNEFVKANPNSLVYTDKNFINLVSQHLNAEYRWLIAKRGSEIVGALPFIKNLGPIGYVYNSLAYYGSYGGVIQNIEDDEAKEKLIERYYDIARETGACCATIITNPLEKDYTFYESIINYDYKDYRIGQITQLPITPEKEELFRSFQDPRPRNIRKAIKDGVQIEKSQSKWAIDFLFETHKREMDAKGGLAKKRQFFDLIPNHLNQNQWMIYIAKKDGRPIAAFLLLYFNKTIEYFTPAIIYEFRNTQASTLIVFKAMLDAIPNGFKYWNWGGTWTSQDGVYNYKKKWNANDFPYYYYIKCFNKDVLYNPPEYYQKEYYGFYTIPYTKLVN